MEMNETLLKISVLMQERNWTCYRLAKESGIPYSSLHSIFRKNYQPSLFTLEKICNGFHITLSEFFSDETPYRIESYQFSKDETNLIKMYRSLNNHEKKILYYYIMGYCRKAL